MIIHDFEQYSESWYKIRLRLATMSELGSICTTKGMASKSMTNFAMKKAAEGLTNRHLDSYSNYAMQHGTDTEPEARRLYAFDSGEDVTQVGFCTTDDAIAGCSPDGLISAGDFWKAGVEFKCPVKPEIHMARLLGPPEIPTDAILQVQGSLWVTKLDWWDYVSYYRDLPLFRVRVYPDIDLHKKIAGHIATFNELVTGYETRIREQYYA